MRRSSEFVHLLKNLERHRFGRRIISLMIRRATQAVEGRVIIPGKPVIGFDDFYEDFWKQKGVPEEVVERLLDKYDECPQCHHPIFDEVIGQSGTKYCSDECARAANDEYNEYLRDCENCGDTYNSLDEGGYVMYHDVCSTDCAWDMIDGYIRNLFRKHPEFDEDKTLEALKAENPGTGRRVYDAPWYESSRQLEADLMECGVRILECDSCGRTGEETETEGFGIEDINDATDEDYWFCSEECAWKAILEYVEYRGNQPRSVCEQIVKQLRGTKHIDDLVHAQALNGAIERITRHMRN